MRTHWRIRYIRKYLPITIGRYASYSRFSVKRVDVSVLFFSCGCCNSNGIKTSSPEEFGMKLHHNLIFLVAKIRKTTPFLQTVAIIAIV